MKNIRIASLLVIGMIALSACSMNSGPKAVGTVSTDGTAPAAKPAAGTVAPTAVNKSAQPAGGDVAMTPTPVVTGTAPLTKTAPITTSKGVTVTSGITPTVDVTPTGTTTVTTGMDQKPTIPSEATDVVSVTLKGTLNVRSGPGANYRIVGFVRRGQSIDVLGMSKDKAWWHIKCPTGPGDSCWLTTNTRFVVPNK